MKSNITNMKEKEILISNLNDENNFINEKLLNCEAENLRYNAIIKEKCN